MARSPVRGVSSAVARALILLSMAGVIVFLPGCQSAGEKEAPAEGRWEVADALYQQGRFDEALAVLRDILLEDPKHVNAAFRSGVIYHRMGRFKESVLYYQRTLEMNPNHLKAHYNLGLIFAKDMVDLKGAQDHLRRFLELQPPPELKAEAEKTLAKVEEQLARLKPGAEGAPGAQTPRHLPGDEKGAAPKSLPETARKKRTKERPSAREKRTSEAAASQPVETGRELQALAWIGKGDAARGVDEKVAAYREAVRLDPPLEEGHLKLGKAYQAKGMLSEAEASFREAVRRRPSSPAANDALLDVLEDQGRWKDALAAGRSLVQVRPDLPWAWERLGKLEERAKNPRGAAEAYQKSLQLDDTRAPVHYRIGVLYDKSLKMPDKAKAHYQKYLQLAPNGPEAATVRARLGEL